MMRTISRAAVSAALLAVIGTFCAAEEPTPKPPFSDAQLEAGAGQASNGLQLRITADRLVLPEKPGPLGAPLIIEPTALHLFLTNVSDQPIVLDAYNLALSRVTMIVVGPDKETVAVLRKPLGFRTRGSLPIDYPQVEPGNKFITMEKLQFPGDFNSLAHYDLYMPGEYKVQVIYSRPAAAGPGVWQGRVVSNTLTFRIEGPLPPTPPENATPPGNATPENPPEPAPQPTPNPHAPPAGTPS
jgi:hypothetical protein